MKFRLTEVTTETGSVFNVYYKRDTPPGTSIESPWIYWAWRYSEEEARRLIETEVKHAQAPVPPERVVEEFDVGK